MKAKKTLTEREAMGCLLNAARYIAMPPEDTVLLHSVMSYFINKIVNPTEVPGDCVVSTATTPKAKAAIKTVIAILESSCMDQIE